MVRIFQLSVLAFLLSAPLSLADGWVVFPVKGGAVAYNDYFLENNQTGTVLYTIANFTNELRQSAKGDYHYAFESWTVDCKKVLMRPEKVVLQVNNALPPILNVEFDRNPQPWVKPGDDRWGQLVVQIACTDAKAPNSQTVANQPLAMDAMAKLGAGSSP